MQTLVSNCPIEDVMRALSGRWPTLLLYYLKDGTKRFSDLRRDNPTVSHRILAMELRKLEAVGLVIEGLADWWEASGPERAKQASVAVS